MSKYSVFGVNIQPEIISEENNILKVSSKKEVFYDIFECTFNGKKIITEKIGEFENKPIVEFKLNKGNKVLNCQAILVIDKEQNNLLLKESKSAKKIRIITEEKKAIAKEERLQHKLITEEKKAIAKEERLKQEVIIEEERLRTESIANEVIKILNKKVRLNEAKKIEEEKQAIKLEQERIQKEKINAEIKLIEEQQKRIKEEEWIEQSKIKLIEEVKRKEIKLIEEAKRLEEERLIEEAKRLEEERLIEERIKQEKIKLIEEAKKLEEEIQIDKTKKLEEEILKEHKANLKFYNNEHSYKIDIDYKYKNIKITNETTGVDKIFESKGVPKKVILNQNTLSYDNTIDEASYFKYTIDIESENVLNKKLVDYYYMGDSPKKRLSGTVADIVKSNTIINIIFDDSGSMNATLAPLQTMAANNLKSVLLPYYNNNETTYDTNVNVILMNSINNANDLDNIQRAENSIACGGLDMTGSTNNVINMMFQDESDARTLADFEGVKTGIAGYKGSVAFLKDRLDVKDNNAAIFFQVPTSPNVTPGVVWKTTLQDLQATLVDTVYESQTSFNYDVTKEGAPSYYADLIVDALNSITS